MNWRMALGAMLCTSFSFFSLVAQVAENVETTDWLAEGTFTSGMEGPSTDRTGTIYAVNYGKEGTIGCVSPDGTHRCLVELPAGSTGNGIRIGADGQLYVADYTGHNILKISPRTRDISVFVHEPRMFQPNDLALAPNGNLYASDPDWAHAKGQLWLIRPDGAIVRLETDMGTTNGIEVSPDGKTLYVGESVQRQVWAYGIRPDGTLTGKRLFHTFEGYGMDGIRSDVKGNLYICRYEKGTVAVLDPEGRLIREIRLKGKKPSNLTFGGPGNRRCYVTLQDRGCFEMFEVPFPGRE